MEKYQFSTKSKRLTCKFTLHQICNFVSCLLNREWKNVDRITGIFATRSPQILITDPSFAKEIEITHFNSFHDNQDSTWSNSHFEQLAPLNPVALTGNVWKSKRQEFSAGLTMNRFKAFYPVMKESAKKMTKYIKGKMDHLKTNELEASDFSKKFAAEIMLDFLWGIEPKAFESYDKECFLVDIIQRMLKQAFDSQTYYSKAQLFPVLREFKQTYFRFYPKNTDDFFMQLQKDCMEYRKNNPSDRADLLEFLMAMQERKNLSLRDVTGHTLTVVLDGYESPGITLAQTLLMLGRNQDAQNKLRVEILDNLGEDGFMDFDVLNGLPYMNQCIQETLRLFPTVPHLIKMCTKDFECQLKNGKTATIDKGTHMHIPIYSYHHDPDVYHDPERYIPERFDPEYGGADKYHKLGNYVPFGAGPRTCTGKRYALVKIRTGLVEFLKNFEFTVSEKTRKDNLTEIRDTLAMSFAGAIYLDIKELQ